MEDQESPSSPGIPAETENPQPNNQEFFNEKGSTSDNGQGSSHAANKMENFKAFFLRCAVSSSTTKSLSPLQRSIIEQHLHDFFPDFHTPDHPPYAAMIQNAIVKLKEEGGAGTEEAISLFIRNEYPDLPKAHDSLLKHHLESLCNDGAVVKFGNRFYMEGDEHDPDSLSDMSLESETSSSSWCSSTSCSSFSSSRRNHPSPPRQKRRRKKGRQPKRATKQNRVHLERKGKRVKRRGRTRKKNVVEEEEDDEDELDYAELMIAEELQELEEQNGRKKAQNELVGVQEQIIRKRRKVKEYGQTQETRAPADTDSEKFEMAIRVERRTKRSHEKIVSRDKIPAEVLENRKEDQAHNAKGKEEGLPMENHSEVNLVCERRQGAEVRVVEQVDHLKDGLREITAQADAAEDMVIKVERRTKRSHEKAVSSDKGKAKVLDKQKEEQVHHVEGKEEVRQLENHSEVNPKCNLQKEAEVQVVERVDHLKDGLREITAQADGAKEMAINVERRTKHSHEETVSRDKSQAEVLTAQADAAKENLSQHSSFEVLGEQSFLEKHDIQIVGQSREEQEKRAELCKRTVRRRIAHPKCVPVPGRSRGRPKKDLLVEGSRITAEVLASEMQKVILEEKTEVIKQQNEVKAGPSAIEGANQVEGKRVKRRGRPCKKNVVEEDDQVDSDKLMLKEEIKELEEKNGRKKVQNELVEGLVKVRGKRIKECGQRQETITLKDTDSGQFDMAIKMEHRSKRSHEKTISWDNTLAEVLKTQKEDQAHCVNGKEEEDRPLENHSGVNITLKLQQEAGVEVMGQEDHLEDGLREITALADTAKEEHQVIAREAFVKCIKFDVIGEQALLEDHDIQIVGWSSEGQKKRAQPCKRTVRERKDHVKCVPIPGRCRGWPKKALLVEESQINAEEVEAEVEVIGQENHMKDGLQEITVHADAAKEENQVTGRESFTKCTKFELKGQQKFSEEHDIQIGGQSREEPKKMAQPCKRTIGGRKAILDLVKELVVKESRINAEEVEASKTEEVSLEEKSEVIKEQNEVKEGVLGIEGTNQVEGCGQETSGCSLMEESVTDAVTGKLAVTAEEIESEEQPEIVMKEESQVKGDSESSEEQRVVIFEEKSEVIKEQNEVKDGAFWIEGTNQVEGSGQETFGCSLLEETVKETETGNPALTAEEIESAEQNEMLMKEDSQLRAEAESCDKHQEDENMNQECDLSAEAKTEVSQVQNMPHGEQNLEQNQLVEKNNIVYSTGQEVEMDEMHNPNPTNQQKFQVEGEYVDSEKIIAGKETILPSESSCTVYEDAEEEVSNKDMDWQNEVLQEEENAKIYTEHTCLRPDLTTSDLSLKLKSAEVSNVSRSLHLPGPISEEGKESSSKKRMEPQADSPGQMGDIDIADKQESSSESSSKLKSEEVSIQPDSPEEPRGGQQKSKRIWQPLQWLRKAFVPGTL